MRTALLALLAVALVAPAGPAAPPAHRVAGDATIAAREVLLTHCGECHSGAAKAKGKQHGRLRVDDYNALTGNGDESAKVDWVAVNPTVRSQVIDFMKDGSMPPGGRKPVPKEQIELVEAWIGLKPDDKEYPADFSERTVLELLLKDLKKLSDQKSLDPARVRYVSFAHLVSKPGAVAAAEADLTAALARLAPNAEGSLKPLNGSAATVFRLDLEAVGWAKGKRFLFEQIIFGGESNGEVRMIPFDLIQLEYPYTHLPPADLKAEVAAAVKAMNAHRKEDPLGQLRAVPFVRGDWLAKALADKGTPTPLGDDLVSLARLAAALGESDDAKGTGPDFRPFAGVPVPDDATALPVWAWYRAGVAPKPPPFRFELTADGANLLDDTGVALSAKVDKARPVVVSMVEVQSDYVEVRKFDLDRGKGQPFLVMDGDGAISPDKSGRYKPTITKKNLGKPICVLLFVSPKEAAHKEPVVVRSRHEGSPVWRLLPHPDDAGETGRPPVLRAMTRIETVPPKKDD